MTAHAGSGQVLKSGDNLINASKTAIRLRSMQAMSAAQNEIFRVWLRRHELEALARARMMGCLRQLSLSVL